MSKKWLSNQLLDIFEKCDQIKDLKPALIGYTKLEKKEKYKNCPKFTTALKMMLLTFSKYEKKCYLGMKKIGKACSYLPQLLLIIERY